MVGKINVFLFFLLVFIFINLTSYATQVTRGRVLKIYDGDTILIKDSEGDKIKVRFRGIDTPETYFMGEAQGYYAELATDFLKDEIPVGSRVKILTPDDIIISYNRLVGRVYYRGEDIGMKLLREGLACIYTIWPYDESFLREYIEAADSAVANGRGMFDFKRPIDELPFEFRKRLSGEPFERWVGNWDTRKYYEPDDYEHIPISKRIFFGTEEAAATAGFLRD